MKKIIVVWLAIVIVLMLCMAALGLRPKDYRFMDQFSESMHVISSIQDKLLIPVRNYFHADGSSLVDPVTGSSVVIRWRSPAVLGDKLSEIKRQIKSDLIFAKVELSPNAYKCLSVTGMLQDNGITDPQRWLVFDVNGQLVQFLYRPFGAFKLMEDHTDDGVIISATWTQDDMLVMQYVNQDNQIVSVRQPIYAEGTVHG